QPSLPSQYFHLLRRQMKRNFRKPLVLMMPKSLLRQADDVAKDEKLLQEFFAGRLQASASKLEEFTDRSFQLVIDDPSELNPQRVRRVLLCSGKIYFTLEAARKKNNVQDIAIVRVE